MHRLAGHQKKDGTNPDRVLRFLFQSYIYTQGYFIQTSQPRIGTRVWYRGELGTLTGRRLKMVQNIGINILIPIALFAFLIFGAGLMASAAFRDKAARLSKKG